MRTYPFIQFHLFYFTFFVSIFPPPLAHGKECVNCHRHLLNIKSKIIELMNCRNTHYCFCTTPAFHIRVLTEFNEWMLKRRPKFKSNGSSLVFITRVCTTSENSNLTMKCRIIQIEMNFSPFRRMNLIRFSHASFNSTFKPLLTFCVRMQFSANATNSCVD